MAALQRRLELQASGRQGQRGQLVWGWCGARAGSGSIRRLAARLPSANLAAGASLLLAPPAAAPPALPAPTSLYVTRPSASVSICSKARRMSLKCCAAASPPAAAAWSATLRMSALSATWRNLLGLQRQGRQHSSPGQR